MESNLVDLFANWQNQGGHIVQLLNRDHIPVAALYLDQLEVQQIMISDITAAEEHCLYLNGIAVFFSYYKKM